MGFFDFDERGQRRPRQNVLPQRPRAKGSISHEMLGGAAAFEAMHLWEKQQRRKGESVSHGFAKEALAAMAGAEADKLWERHHGRNGGNERDREREREHARRQVEKLYDQQYGQRKEWNPSHGSHESMRFSGYSAPCPFTFCCA
ncbi:hypothetical protein QBC36DRAFT_345336 [Triangularia setosa]|uniref:Uncharacterized protein n=1 Tax=Triangularia setosa TaxID=2587417 RepID=A0AAN6WAP8_9PEZI|nr:hypothetical protein QBC36DRAFT_345336 [Podospora setosa]